jgi:hypothetical protein
MLISVNAEATGKEITASMRALNESYRPQGDLHRCPLSSRLLRF